MEPLYKDIVNDVKEQINDGVLNEGDKLLSERDLAHNYGVSRNVVREAIGVLRVEGLLSVYAGKGAYVTKFNPIMITETIERIMKNYNTTIEDVLEVRESLEISIIKKTVKAATKDDVKKLYNLYEKMELNKLNLKHFIELDVEFHKALAQSTKNPLFYLLLNSFIEMTQHILFVFTRWVPESVTKAQQQHLSLIKAIENGDEQRGVEVINAHMQILREEIKLLKRENLIQPN